MVISTPYNNKCHTLPCYRWFTDKIPIIILRDGAGKYEDSTSMIIHQTIFGTLWIYCLNYDVLTALLYEGEPHNFYIICVVPSNAPLFVMNGFIVQEHPVVQRVYSAICGSKFGIIILIFSPLYCIILSIASIEFLLFDSLTGMLDNFEPDHYMRLLRSQEITLRQMIFKWRDQTKDPDFEGLPGYLESGDKVEALPNDMWTAEMKKLDAEWQKHLAGKNSCEYLGHRSNWHAIYVNRS